MDSSFPQHIPLTFNFYIICVCEYPYVVSQFFAKELNPFDLVFFEKVEDLKYNYQPASVPVPGREIS